VHSVALEHRCQPMYNLAVAVAHTFFVGDEQWLVHNADRKCIIKLGFSTILDCDAGKNIPGLDYRQWHDEGITQYPDNQFWLQLDEVLPKAKRINFIIVVTFQEMDRVSKNYRKFSVIVHSNGINLVEVDI